MALAGPVRDGADDGHHCRGPAGLALLRGEEPLPDAAPTATCSPSASATSPRARAGASPWDRRRPARRPWTRRDRAPSCHRSCSRSAPCCCCCSAPRCSPTSRLPRSARSSGVAILPLLGIREFRSALALRPFRVPRRAVCFLVTLFVGSIPGIVVAFVLALINLAKRAANPAIDVLGDDDSPTDSLLDDAPVGSVTVPGHRRDPDGRTPVLRERRVFSQAVKRAVTAVAAGRGARPGHRHGGRHAMSSHRGRIVRGAEGVARERRRDAVIQPGALRRARAARGVRHPRGRDRVSHQPGRHRRARAAHRLA